MWLVPLIMLSWITKIKLELMAYGAMFATYRHANTDSTPGTNRDLDQVLKPLSPRVLAYFDWLLRHRSLGLSIIYWLMVASHQIISRLDAFHERWYLDAWFRSSQSWSKSRIVIGSSNEFESRLSWASWAQHTYIPCWIVWLIKHQKIILLFSHRNKSAISNQSAVLFSQNKSALVTSQTNGPI
jgi:hypothetical protein